MTAPFGIAFGIFVGREGHFTQDEIKTLDDIYRCLNFVLGPIFLIKVMAA